MTHEKPEPYYVEYTTDALWRVALQKARGVADAVDPADTYAIKDFHTEQAARLWASKRKYTCKVWRRADIRDLRQTEGLDWPVPMWAWDDESVAEYTDGVAMELEMPQ